MDWTEDGSPEITRGSNRELEAKAQPSSLTSHRPDITGAPVNFQFRAQLLRWAA